MAHDLNLAGIAGKVSIVVLPKRIGIAEGHAAFLSSIPPEGNRYFVSGNPATISPDRASDIKCLKVRNRASVADRSAARIRELILKNTPAAMAEVRQELPKGVYEVMSKGGCSNRFEMLPLAGKTLKSQ